MSNKHLLWYPKHIHRSRCTVSASKAWWYEENGGITLVCEVDDQSAQFTIPWRQLRASLERKDMS